MYFVALCVRRVDCFSGLSTTRHCDPGCGGGL